MKYEDEIKGADFALMFWKYRDGYSIIRFDDGACTDHGDPWWPDAYGNAHIYLRSGAIDAIYLMSDDVSIWAGTLEGYRQQAEEKAVRIIRRDNEQAGDGRGRPGADGVAEAVEEGTQLGG